MLWTLFEEIISILIFINKLEKDDFNNECIFSNFEFRYQSFIFIVTMN